MTVANDYTYMADQFFYYFDEEEFKKDIALLHQNTWNINDNWSDTKIEGTVTASANQIFFTSIPNEPGWTVKVDGKKADIIDVADGFIGVELMPGEHTVSMSFFPAGLAPGILLAVAGIGLVVVFILMDKKKTFRPAARPQKKEPVPAPAN